MSEPWFEPTITTDFGACKLTVDDLTAQTFRSMDLLLSPLIAHDYDHQEQEGLEAEGDGHPGDSSCTLLLLLLPSLRAWRFLPVALFQQRLIRALIGKSHHHEIHKCRFSFFRWKHNYFFRREQYKTILGEGDGLPPATSAARIVHISEVHTAG